MQEEGEDGEAGVEDVEDFLARFKSSKMPGLGPSLAVADPSQELNIKFLISHVVKEEEEKRIKKEDFLTASGWLGQADPLNPIYQFYYHIWTPNPRFYSPG